MRNLTQGIVAFSAIFLTCVAGALHMSWWAALAGACVLVLVSICSHSAAHRALGFREIAPAILYSTSALNALTIASAALVAGRVIGWVWGA